MNKSITSQFGHPRGVLGSLAGMLMAKRNHERTQFVIDQMAVTEGDTVLEVGFGPGLGIQKLFVREPNLSITGLELSKVMLRQASRRNRAQIIAGNLDLQIGDGCEMPFKDATFDLVYSVNTLHHVASLEKFAAEINRILRPNGMAVLAHQHPMKWVDAPVPGKMKKIKTVLETQGFYNSEIIQKAMKPSPTYVLKALNK
ncbi:class I SAM-dependent methyltransferase [bacterium]|nr:class I SAM-dependent methyltransferase [bacterium]